MRECTAPNAQTSTGVSHIYHMRLSAVPSGVATIITDTPRFSHIRKERVALWACLLGFFCSVAFITDIGSFLFDIFDHFLLNYGAIC